MNVGQTTTRLALALIIPLVLSACGSSTSDDDAGQQGTADSGVQSQDTGVADSGLADTGTTDAGGAPGAPVLLSVQVVQHGTMGLSWQNPGSGCTTIEISRKVGSGAYAHAKTVTGSVTESNDEPGHANGTYCYTLVCRLNGVDYNASNERCATQ